MKKHTDVDQMVIHVDNFSEDPVFGFPTSGRRFSFLRYDRQHSLFYNFVISNKGQLISGLFTKRFKVLMEFKNDNK